MRQIILDTETTGLETSNGHRIIEIGCVEMVDRRLSGKHFHQYINPQRDIDDGALEVHGISREFLEDKPLFSEVAEDFIIIHNAPFDVGFLEHEMSLLGREDRLVDHATVLDTLVLARDLHPGQRNSLDALCKRYEVDNSSRTLHGALLDAEILADVYLAMTGGQTDLGLSFQSAEPSGQEHGDPEVSERPALQVLTASEPEITAHEVRLKAIQEESGHCLWNEL